MTQKGGRFSADSMQQNYPLTFNSISLGFARTLIKANLLLQLGIEIYFNIEIDKPKITSDK